MWTDSDDDSFEDPDYVPSDDSEHNSYSSLDRCRYIREHSEILAQLYASLKSTGCEALGDAFLQLCSFHDFANFCYKKTQPTADFPN